MISYVAKLLYILASSVQNIVHVTSLLGETILTVIKWIYLMLLNVINNILLFFQIVYDDNIIIFTEDLPNCHNIVIETITNQFHTLWIHLCAVLHGILTYLNAIQSNIICALNSIVFIGWQVILVLKNTFIYFGNTVWFIITFIPVHLPHLLQVFTRYALEVIVAQIVDGYMTLLQFTNYLTEVPLESFLGISIFIIVTRLCIHFRTQITTQIVIFYWTLIRNIMYCFYMFLNYFTNSEVRVITRMANGEDLRAEDHIENYFNEEADHMVDSLCVICQERQKCVLTLPCRHVCLCADCCRRLYGYQRTCPICRTFIYHSVTVYL